MSEELKASKKSCKDEEYPRWEMLLGSSLKYRVTCRDRTDESNQTMLCRSSEEF
jgi:hypothetical protein